MGWGKRMMSGELSCELSDGMGGFVVKMMMIMWDTLGWRFCQKGWWKSNLFQMGGCVLWDGCWWLCGAKRHKRCMLACFSWRYIRFTLKRTPPPNHPPSSSFFFNALLSFRLTLLKSGGASIPNSNLKSSTSLCNSSSQ